MGWLSRPGRIQAREEEGYKQEKRKGMGYRQEEGYGVLQEGTAPTPTPAPRHLKAGSFISLVYTPHCLPLSSSKGFAVCEEHLVF
ncbi:hypothetical protein Pmani_039195 [Petrolisthes manimaculis]|uniref:Uncharacterized protein n=1 Tax=Petrolisthes manimaculis TaxID=1843537 RepID=A0AAE1ND54_9EUCA|nr:hypothetical protein Pmani_039195 [Petrolisthes manimaculis]